MNQSNCTDAFDPDTDLGDRPPTPIQQRHERAKEKAKQKECARNSSNIQECQLIPNTEVERVAFR